MSDGRVRGGGGDDGVGRGGGHLPAGGVLGQGPAAGDAGWVEAVAGFIRWLEADMRALSAEYADRCGRLQAAKDAHEAGTGSAEDVEFWAFMADNAAHFRRQREELRYLVSNWIDRQLLRRMGDWARTWEYGEAA